MNIAVCDDDEKQLSETISLCEMALIRLKITVPNLIQPFYSGEKLIQMLPAENPPSYDIIIMDIEFGSDTVNGIETVKALRQMGVSAPVIITTSYDTYLRQGYGLGIMRYLSKPISPEELCEALSACIKSMQTCEGKIILLKNGTDNVAVKYKDILYFECFGHTVIAHTKDKSEYPLHKTIGFIEEQVPKSCFVKVNKGTIANLGGIAYISGNDLVFEDGTVLPVAQRRRRQVLEFFREYVKEHI